MYFFRPALVEEFRGFPKLRPTHNRIIDQQHFLSFNQSVYRNQLHSGNQISLALLRRHERTRPGRGIFDKRTCKGNSRFIGIANGMGNARIRYACRIIDLHVITPCQHLSAVITHLFHIYSLIGRGRVSIIYPQKRTDFHFFSRRTDRLHTLRRYVYDLSGAQLLIIRIAQIDVRKAFEGSAVSVFFLSDDKRRSAQPVPGRIDSVLCHDQHCDRTFYSFLHIANPFHNTFFFTDHRRHQFCSINFPAAHLLKVRRAIHDLF